MSVDPPRDDDDLFREINRLAQAMPSDEDLHHKLLSLGGPENAEAAQDRHVATAGASAVEAALKRAISQHHPDRTQADLEAMFSRKPLATFNGLIEGARTLGIVTDDQARELHRLRKVRNAFAHAVNAVSFDDEAVAALMKRLWHYPVTNWAAYFAPAFPPRSQFAIICETFCATLLRYRPGGAPISRTASTS